MATIAVMSNAGRVIALPSSVHGTPFPLRLNEYNIEGDGNCLFRALALGVFADENKHHKLCMTLVNAARMWDDDLHVMMCGTHLMEFHSYETYAWYMSQNKVWGSFGEIFLFERVFHRMVFVWYENHHENFHIMFHGNGNLDEAIHLCYKNGCHFNLLRQHSNGMMYGERQIEWIQFRVSIEEVSEIRRQQLLGEDPFVSKYGKESARLFVYKVCSNTTTFEAPMTPPSFEWRMPSDSTLVSKNNSLAKEFKHKSKTHNKTQAIMGITQMNTKMCEQSKSLDKHKSEPMKQKKRKTKTSNNSNIKLQKTASLQVSVDPKLQFNERQPTFLSLLDDQEQIRKKSVQKVFHKNFQDNVKKVEVYAKNHFSECYEDFFRPFVGITLHQSKFRLRCGKMSRSGFEDEVAAAILRDYFITFFLDTNS